MKEFRVVGILQFTNGITKVDYDSWGRCDVISIETMNQLANAYNIKYKEWYLEFR